MSTDNVADGGTPKPVGVRRRRLNSDGTPKTVEEELEAALIEISALKRQVGALREENEILKRSKPTARPKESYASIVVRNTAMDSAAPGARAVFESLKTIGGEKFGVKVKTLRGRTTVQVANGKADAVKSALRTLPDVDVRDTVTPPRKFVITGALWFEDVETEIRGALHLTEKCSVKVVKFRDGERCLIIVRTSVKVPSSLLLGYQSLVLKEEKVVTLCYKCGQVGHIQRFCSNSDCCLKCGGGHATDFKAPCQGKVKCLRCGGEHWATATWKCSKLEKPAAKNAQKQVIEPAGKLADEQIARIIQLVRQQLGA
jgi:hypothetical protein